jgi:hypothetical protein
METRNLTLHTLRYHSSVSARPGKKEKYRLRQRSACMHYFARTNSINSAYYHMQEAFRPRLLQPYSAPTKSTSITCTSITVGCRRFECQLACTSFMSISWERDFRYRVGSFHFDWSIGTLVLRLFFKAWGETGQHDGTTTVPSTFWCKLHVDLLTACVSASAWLTSMSMYSPTTMYTNCSAAAVVRVQYAGMLRSVDCVYNGSKVRRSYSLEALATRLLQRAYQSFLSGFSVRYCRVLTDKRVTNQTMPGVSLLRWYL